VKPPKEVAKKIIEHDGCLPPYERRLADRTRFVHAGMIEALEWAVQSVETFYAMSNEQADLSAYECAQHATSNVRAKLDSLRDPGKEE
jgi:hypothetical protein